MPLVQAFIVLTAVYFAIYFVDAIFRTCCFLPYIRFLEGTGFNVGIGTISWHTTVFNRSLQTWRLLRRKFLYRWFDLGILCTIILFPVSMYILTKQLLFAILRADEYNEPQVALDAIIPGVNVPHTDISYYIISLTLSSVIHELGHFIAARREDISILNVGLMIIFILPIGFVRLSSYQLNSISPKKQLRVVCAGVWHNIVLSAMVYVVIIVLPVLLEPLYEIGKGVKVKSVSENSPVVGPKGIFVGDQLSAINDCEVSDTERWRYCLKLAIRKPSPGYCVTEDLVHQMDESVPLRHGTDGSLECCDPNKNGYLCFETLLMADGDGQAASPLEILPHSCLPGRLVVAGTSFACRQPKDCPPPTLHCIRPLLPNNTKLLRIQRFSDSATSDNDHNIIIFIGNPMDVLRSLDLTDYIPKYSFSPSQLPDVIFRLGTYVTALSSGLAFVNAVPCFFTDGYHIIHALLQLFAVKPSQQKSLLFLFNSLGTFLLFSNISIILWRKLFH